VKNEYFVIGLMSGTSLDGLDIAACKFNYNKHWNYQIIKALTIKYPDELKHELSNAFYSGDQQLTQLDDKYGNYIGTQLQEFILGLPEIPELICSHGHTVFHRPADGITIQIGSGKRIHELVNIPVVNNFRQQDVLLGGQGAPLVPLGDEILFSNYDCCINLGGFSNISWKSANKRLACDMSPCNILLNSIASKLNLAFDKNGEISRSGTLIEELYIKWNQIEFFNKKAPKSLGREWFENHYLNDLSESRFEPNDLLFTATEHVAEQISKFIFTIGTENANYLFTGGGAHNIYLMERLSHYFGQKLNPSEDYQLIDFKEAIVFAFLGLLRILGKINVLSSVTGAVKDHSAGDIWT
jgi:anhydro-N-acetylmuramic acid kinase